MLHLWTGGNGSGKSLHALQKMHELHAKGIKIFAHGFHDLKVPFADESLHPKDWQQMPPGSAMFVDEAQKVWRSRKGNQAVPPEVMAMEEHRFEGVDIYLITQDPMFVDSHVRGLINGVDSHQHHIAYGNKKSRIFKFSECYENTQSTALRKNSNFEIWDHWTPGYAMYTSALEHMEKAKIPWAHRKARLIQILGGLFVLAILGSAGWVWANRAKASPLAAKGDRDRVEVGGFSLFGGSAKGAKTLSAEEWILMQRPRVPSIPSSAPIFDGRRAQAQPMVACMSSKESCSCITEQGTHYALPDDQCRHMAYWGPVYDPFKAPDRSSVAQRATQAAGPQQVASSGAHGPIIVPTEPSQIGPPGNAGSLIWGK